MKNYSAFEFGVFFEMVISLRTGK